MDSITAHPDFRGWYMTGDAPMPIYCPSTLTYITSGSYATCCASSSCKMVTECHDNTLYSDSGTGRFCGTRNADICGTVSIYQSSPSGLPIMTQIHCHLEGRSNIMYRELPAATLPSSIATATSTEPLTTEPPTTSTQPTATATTTSSSSEGGTSQAWIAGAVIGPKAGIALVGLAFFMFWRRRRRGAGSAGVDSPAGDQQHLEQQQQMQKPGYIPEAPGSYPMQSGYPHSYPKTGDNSASSSPPWQQGSQRPVHEMNASYPAQPSELDSAVVYEMHGQPQQHHHQGQGHGYGRP